MEKLTTTNRPEAMPLDTVFAALADPTRRAIVERLAQGRATVGTVAAPHDMAPPSISKHLKVLESAGLITRQVEGRQHWLRLVPDGFRDAAEWFTHYQQFWTESLDRLAGLMAELEQEETQA